MNKIEEKLLKGYEKESQSIFGFFIKNFRFTYLIILSIIILGTFSLFTIPREANPEIKVPFAVVTTIYPGTNPSDVEELVTDKIEIEIKNLDNLKIYTSSSGIGFSSIFVEFDARADLKDSFQKLRDAVDEAVPNLPDGAETPSVTEINFNDIPIVTYSLVGDFSDEQLKQYANLLQNEFEDIRSVSKAPIIGGIEKEFQIIADQEKLANFNISLSQIAGSISRENFNIPAGDIDIDGLKYNLRVKGRVTKVDDIKNIVIATYNESPVYIRDVAQVTDGFKERTSESRIGFSQKEALNTVSLQIYKKTGGNILEIIELAQNKIDVLKNDERFPSNLEIIKTNDNSQFIKKDIKRLGTSGLQTMGLILIFLIAVLSFRGALITAFSLPIAFLITFILLNVQGQTINGMVLFSLVLSLGLMVDNSIIIIEGISEYITEFNKTPLQAAVLSVWNYKWPIISGTMTTVAAFLPMLLVSGILGQYMGILPKTISATLMSSLFVALVILPTLATRFIKIEYKKGEQSKHRNKKRHIFVEKYMRKIRSVYTKFLKTVLTTKKYRRRLIAGAWISFFIAVSLPFMKVIDIQMFPQIDIDYFAINAKLPAGSSIESTSKVLEKAEEIIRNIPELDNYVTSIGSNFSPDGSQSGSGEHLGNIIVNLVEGDFRNRKSYDVADSIRDSIQNIQGGTLTLEELSAGPPTGAPIEVRITGDDLKTLSTIGEEVKNKLKEIDGVINIKDNVVDSTGDFVFTIDKQKANFYGLDTITVSNNLRSAVFGAGASEINVDGEDVDITVKYDRDSFSSIDDINNLLIFTPRGENIKLKQIAEVKLEPSVLSINHRNGDKVVIVTAQIEKSKSLPAILDEFDNKKKEILIPSNTSIDVGGEVEDIQQSYSELFLSMILAVILIAFILTLQFNSFKQPFIILFSLPLAIIGVIIGLIITGLPFSLPVFIGIVSLSGIAVNDAIVLIDRINKNLNSGMEFIHGIIEAGLSRMQPIFLTTATTVAGIFPLIFADELWLGLSVTVIFGLIFSTFLTLIVVPAFYVTICKNDFNKHPQALIKD